MKVTNLPCPICPRRSWLTAEGLAAHLLAEHTAANLAAELASFVAVIFSAPLPDPHPRPATPRPGPHNTPCAKRGFPSQDEALRGLLATWQSRSPSRREQRAYLCDRCQRWHLTSQPERTTA